LAGYAATAAWCEAVDTVVTACWFASLQGKKKGKKGKKGKK
jgi:hypothetical protein